MDKNEIKRRINRRIDEDERFAASIDTALRVENDLWLAQLIGEVIGVIIDIATDFWRWVKSLF